MRSDTWLSKKDRDSHQRMGATRTDKGVEIRMSSMGERIGVPMPSVWLLPEEAIALRDWLLVQFPVEKKEEVVR